MMGRIRPMRQHNALKEDTMTNRFGAGQVIDTHHGIRYGKSGKERKDNIGYGDGLRAVLEPLRQNHSRKPNRQIAHDFPARSPFSDPHRGMKLNRRYRALP